MTENDIYNSPQPDQNQNEIFLDSEDTSTDLTYPKTRIRLGLFMTVFGYIIFLLGARPSLFGLDRSRVIGFVQISVFLVGLALISLGSVLTLNAFWTEGRKTIAADIGGRLISTGYVICVFTAMADIFGLGSHPLPDVFFGELQARGMEIGMGTIALGFLLLIRYKRTNNHVPNSQKKVEQNESNKPTMLNEGPDSIQAV